jgi:hypothetical protein
MSNLLYSWSFDSKKNRGSLWYVIMLSIAIGLIIWGFLSKQFWMSFVIIILIWLIFYVENNSDDIVNINILETWIKVESNFYAFSNLSSYTIIYENDMAVLLRLNISGKFWTKNIDIWIDNTIVSDVQNILSKFVEENNKEQLTFTEKMTRLLKL